MPKKAAIFLDRDGVIIRDVHHLRHEKQLRLLPGAAKALRGLVLAGWPLVIISNQGAVAKGLMSKEKMYEIDNILQVRLAQKGVKLAAAHYCPHHPRGTVQEHTRKCFCRKPNPGMFLRAAAELNINLKKSYTIGDKTGDILAGKRAGTRTILVKTGYGGKDRIYEVEPDYVARNLMAAARIITKHA
ncbi:MAG: HAD family hydrolase [Candidatus Liptonbacteria bacterium]